MSSLLLFIYLLSMFTISIVAKQERNNTSSLENAIFSKLGVVSSSSSSSIKQTTNDSSYSLQLNIQNLYEKFKNDDKLHQLFNKFNEPYNVIRAYYGATNGYLNVTHYKRVNSTYDKLNGMQKSVFLRIEQLSFKKKYVFKLDNKVDDEKLAGVELSLSLDLFELIRLNGRRKSTRKNQHQREPIHEIDVKIVVFEQKITKISKRKSQSSKFMSSYTQLGNKTVKFENHLSQKEFFNSIKRAAKDRITLNLSNMQFNSTEDCRIQIEFEINLRTSSHAYSLKNSSSLEQQLFKENPLLTVYLNDGNAKKIPEGSIKRKSMKRMHNNNSNNNCKRIPWTIDFSDIKWDRYIIQPKRLESFYCGGSCNGPFDNNSLNASNHAIMQFLASASGYYNFLPKLSCVPTEYAPEYFLIRDSRGNISIKLIDDIIVKSCGCR